MRQLLRCPECKNTLHRPDRLSPVWCGTCRVWYPNTGGITRFVAAAVDAGFDQRWKQHPKPQATTRGVFEQKTGWRPEDLGGKLVLDAGCGCGRFSRVVTDFGAEVAAVDGSTHAVEAAAKLVPDALVVQANLFKLPFPAECFDTAFSIGVLHHTGDTRQAFLEVARTIRRGGELAVWLYCPPTTDPTIARAMAFLHDITKACPPDRLHAACEKHAVALRDLYAGAWGPLQQVLRVSSSADADECSSDTLDWHTPQHRDYHDYPEVEGWFAEAGFDVVWRGSFPTSVRGCKR